MICFYLITSNFQCTTFFALANTPLTQHGAFFSHDAHRCELWSPHFRARSWNKKTQIPKKKPTPSAHFFACKPRSWNTVAALSFYTNITAGLLKSACRVESTFPWTSQPLIFCWEKYLSFAYTLPMNNSALCNAHEHVRFLFWGVSSPPRWPCWGTCSACWPCSFTERKTFGGLQRHR